MNVLVLLVVTMSILSCDMLRGPTGPQGEQGPQGEPGSVFSTYSGRLNTSGHAYVYTQIPYIESKMPVIWVGVSLLSEGPWQHMGTEMSGDVLLNHSIYNSNGKATIHLALPGFFSGIIS